MTVASPPPIPQVRILNSVNGLTLPLEQYRFTPEQNALVTRVRANLVDRCMQRFGLRRPGSPTTGQAPDLMARRYGVTDPQIAARWGYHLTPADGTAERPRAGEPVSPAEMLVWTGRAEGRTPPRVAKYNGMVVPEGGCAGEAGRKLEFADREDVAESLVLSIEFSAFRQATADARVRAVFAEWSACMHAKGYDYPDPLAAGGSADVTSAQPSAAEIRTATADVACKTQHNVIGVWFAVESAYQTALIDTKLEELLAAQAKMAVIVRNARAAA